MATAQQRYYLSEIPLNAAFYANCYQETTFCMFTGNICGGGSFIFNNINGGHRAHKAKNKDGFEKLYGCYGNVLIQKDGYNNMFTDDWLFH